jgi:hypothetical protein
MTVATIQAAAERLLHRTDFTEADYDRALSAATIDIGKNLRSPENQETELLPAGTAGDRADTRGHC